MVFNMRAGYGVIIREKIELLFRTENEKHFNLDVGRICDHEYYALMLLFNYLHQASLLATAAHLTQANS